MAKITEQTKSFYVRILLNNPTVTFHPFPGDEYFTFTWKKQLVPRLLSDEVLSEEWRPVRHIDRPGCWLTVTLKTHRKDPCLYQDLVLVLPRKVNGDDTPPLIQARTAAICHFWEDFFCHIYRIPHRHQIEKSMRAMWEESKGGLPLGLYVQVREVTETFDALSGMNL